MPPDRPAELAAGAERDLGGERPEAVREGVGGVDVHLVVNKVADQVLVSLAQRSYYQELLESGVRIHLYKERFLHAKHMSIDSDIALIGSSNMDIRSFQLNNEISLLLYDSGVTSLLAAEQQRRNDRPAASAPRRPGRVSRRAGSDGASGGGCLGGGGAWRVPWCRHLRLAGNRLR